MELVTDEMTDTVSIQCVFYGYVQWTDGIEILHGIRIGFLFVPINHDTKIL
jgi:hypothetical protein